MSGVRNWFDYVRPLGIVFGDIGTSPLYTISLMGFILKEKDPSLMMGGISLVFWIVVLVVYVQYVFIVMNLSIRGEGGQLIIREYVLSLVRQNPFLRNLVSFLGLFGFCAVVSEGILTPAISILSAVEGLKVIKGDVSTGLIVFLSIVVALVLFFLQRRGTNNISFLFTPIISLWFLSLFIIGLIYIVKKPEIIGAINPVYILELFRKDPLDFLIIISYAMLAITGVEAMYADMGHLGKKPIIVSWNIVFISLMTNYFGQGAFYLLNHSKLNEYNSFLFYMVKDIFPSLYFPFIFLTLLSTIIASQAMISAMFSIFYQTSNLGLLPRFKYIHTSSELKHQIYVPFINWLLLVLVIFSMLFFKGSANIANAYGLSVNLTILISCIMAIIAFIYTRKIWLVLLLSVVVLPTDVIILVSNFHKFANGGYFPFVTSLLMLFLVLIYMYGNSRLAKKLEYVKYSDFINKYKDFYKREPKVNGIAVFALRDINMISPYIIRTIFDFKIIYQKSVFLSLKITDFPYGKEYSYRDLDEDETLGIIEVKAGYLEIIDINDILNRLNIDPTIVFYGQENISTNSIIMKVYSFLRKVSPGIIDFYNFPLTKTIGITTNIHL